MKQHFLLITVGATCLTVFQGCASSGTKSPNENGSSAAQKNQPTAVKCQPFQKVIQTPDGGTLVSSVEIIRDGEGNITTKWKTTFQAGTQSTIDLLLWKPNKRDSPGLDESGTDTTSCDGNSITNTKPFTNAGKGYNQGQYYAYLSFFEDDSNWKQPEGTKQALAAAKGRVRAVSQYAPGGRTVMFELFARFELPSCANLQAVATPSPKAITDASSPVSRLLSRNELAESFRQMLSQTYTCFDYAKATWTYYKGEYVLGGATTGAKAHCIEYLPRIDFSSENKIAADWVNEHRESLVAAKVTHVNLFYCTDPAGKSCHFQTALDVK